jgi:hypothetical protein
MTWALLTFFSGGLDNGSLLGLGGLVALWMQLALDEKVTGTAFSGPQPPRALQSGHSETLAARAAGV